MKASAREWIEKAEADFVSAEREYRARKRPNYDAACFFAQQCVEKYLKALLQKHGIAFGKTHDLAVLMRLCLDKYPLWEPGLDDMEALSRYAVQFRYPGESAEREDALESMRIMRVHRTQIRRAMGLRTK